MNDDFDMADVRRRLASIEAGKHDGEFHYVFDLVHAVHSELLKIAKSTITKVNQGLHNRLPEDITCELAATPDMHPHLRAQKSSGRDWETVSRYIEMEATEIADDGSYTDVDIMLRLVRLADHPRKKKPDDNPNVARVKFKINKLIVVRSAEGTIYEWSSLPWKPQKVDLMNGRNTLAPKAGHGGKMIVKPTFFIRPNDMQEIKKDARKRIPEAIYKTAKELVHKKWDEEEHGSSS